MSAKDIWNPAPKGFKGGKLGWVETKVREKMLKIVYESQKELKQ